MKRSGFRPPHHEARRQGQASTFAQPRIRARRTLMSFCMQIMLASDMVRAYFRRLRMMITRGRHSRLRWGPGEGCERKQRKYENAEQGVDITAVPNKAGALHMKYSGCSTAAELLLSPVKSSSKSGHHASVPPWWARVS